MLEPLLLVWLYGDEVLDQQPAQHLVRVAAAGLVHVRMAFAQFRGIDLNLDQVSERGKLLPVEAGLLHAQARPQGDDQIGLLQQDVAVAHTPSVRPAEVVGELIVDPVGAVVSGHRGSPSRKAFASSVRGALYRRQQHRP